MTTHREVPLAIDSTGGLRRVMSHGLPRESPTGKTWIL